MYLNDIEEFIEGITEYIIGEGESFINNYKSQPIPKNIKRGRRKGISVAEVKVLYQKIKKLGTRGTNNKVFYNQAKLIENVEFDDGIVEMDNNGYYDFYYLPYNYQDLSLEQFKDYLTWRYRIEHQEFDKVKTGKYKRIYFSEIFNFMRCKNVEQAFEKLINYWKWARTKNEYIDIQMIEDLKHFFVVSDCNFSYDELIKQYPIKLYDISKDIRDVYKNCYDNKLKFLASISKYRIEKSKLLEERQLGKYVEPCIGYVLTKLSEELKKQNINLNQMLYVKEEELGYWKPLGEYYVYRPNYKDKAIIINGTERYCLENGEWSRCRYLESEKYCYTIGFLLKTIECYIRSYLGYRTLKLPQKEEMQKDIYGRSYLYKEQREVIKKLKKMPLNEIIESAVKEYFISNKVPELVFKNRKKQKEEWEEPKEEIKIEFHINEFNDIRKKSQEIQKALIIEDENQECESILKDVNTRNEQESQNIQENHLEENKEELLIDNLVEIAQVENKEVAKNGTLEEIQNLVKTNEKEENVFKKFVCSLDMQEKQIIESFVNEPDKSLNMIQNLSYKIHKMPEVIISTINDKAIETIGDTIINSDMSGIYEEYKEDLKKNLL